ASPHPAPPDTPPPSLHDALPISVTAFNASYTGIRCSGPSCTPFLVTRLTAHQTVSNMSQGMTGVSWWKVKGIPKSRAALAGERRSEEHTSELQSRFDLVCRLLLE